MRRDASLAAAIFALACLTAALPKAAGIAPAGKPPARIRPAPPVALPTLPRPREAAAARFDAAPGIWPHPNAPAAHEVALFRQTFALPDGAAGAQLDIFADTRYEVWLDGVWLARGPARFSRDLREYDPLDLGALAPGVHTLAALVQWSPNTRRSESIAPLLQAQMTVTDARSRMWELDTGTGWRSMRAGAWRADAAPLHAWGLLGSSEILDLRGLPADWMAPGYDDSGWAAAVRVPVPPARYEARSIPPLALTPITATVRAAGDLSAGGQLHVIGAGAAAWTLDIASTQAYTFETLANPATGAISWTARLDGAVLDWPGRDDWHPDLRRAFVTLPAGPHRLEFGAVPEGGWPLAVSPPMQISGALPPGALAHVGRRLLLARPSRAPDAVQVEPGPRGLDLEFNRAPSFVVLDLGRDGYGRFEATVNGPPGTVLDVAWDERMWQGLYPLAHPGSLHPEMNQADSWILDGAPRDIRTIDARAGRYVLLAVWGGGPVRVSGARVVEERYPVAQRGSFSSSDPRLDAIWRIGRDTVMLNMLDAYADPWRERGQWWGDAYIDDMVNAAAFGDTRLLLRGLRFMAGEVDRGMIASMAPQGDGVNMIDYALVWVHTIRAYLSRSSDGAPVAREMLPRIQRLLARMAQLEDTQTGLLVVPDGHWSQTAMVDWAAYYSAKGRLSQGQSAAVNALYFQALQDGAVIAEQAGDAGQSAAWGSRARQLQGQVQAALYLADEQRFSSTLLNGQRVAPTVHAQAWPLAAGMVAPELAPHVADALVETLSRDPLHPSTDTYGFNWILEALGKSGRIADALDWINLYYRGMRYNGFTTWGESFTSAPLYTQSLSHGWSSGPTWFLSRYVSGIAQVGMNEWRIAPNLGGLAYAQGEAPAGAGTLSVRIQRWGCDGFMIRMQVPAGQSARLIPPREGGLDYALIAADGTTSAARAMVPPADGILIEGAQDVTRVFVQAGACAPRTIPA